MGGVGGLCARAVCRQSGTSSSVPELEFTSSCCVSVAEESDSEFEACKYIQSFKRRSGFYEKPNQKSSPGSLSITISQI